MDVRRSFCMFAMVLFDQYIKYNTWYNNTISTYIQTKLSTLMLWAFEGSGWSPTCSTAYLPSDSIRVHSNRLCLDRWTFWCCSDPDSQVIPVFCFLYAAANIVTCVEGLIQMFNKVNRISEISVTAVNINNRANLSIFEESVFSYSLGLDSPSLPKHKIFRSQYAKMSKIIKYCHTVPCNFDFQHASCFTS